MSKKPGRSPVPQPHENAVRVPIAASRVPEGKGAAFAWIVMLVVAVIFLQSRLRLLAIPLERDEGGFAYAGYWMFRGDRLYTDILDSKLPGLYLLYGLLTNILGLNPTVVHLGLLISNVVTTVLFYKIVRNLYNAHIAAWTVAFLFLLLLSPTVYGFAAYATQILLPFAIGGFSFFYHGLRWSDWRRFLWAGLCFGLVVLIKQPGIVFGMIAVVGWFPLRIWWKPHKDQTVPWREWGALVAGCVLPTFLVFLYFAAVGRLYDLYDATLLQPALLMQDVEIRSHWGLFWQNFREVMRGFEGIWILGLLGLIVAWRQDHRIATLFFAAGLFVAGMLSVRIGVGYYPHYFITALPGLALLAGIALYAIQGWPIPQARLIAQGIGSALLLMALVVWRGYFFAPDYVKIHRAAYGLNLGPEMEDIGKRLRGLTDPGESIGILGSEPALLVAAGRKSSTRHLFMYGLFNRGPIAQQYQTEYEEALKKAEPRFLVWQYTTGSWRPGADSTPFVKGLESWVNMNYQIVGITEVKDQDKLGTTYWLGDLQRARTQGDRKKFLAHLPFELNTNT